MISILMSFRNEEAFLAECLESICLQSEKNWELIAIDDHSSDLSWNILQDFVSKDSRIKALKNNGKGIIPALNQAFQFSTGELITRMDADDIMPIRKLEKLKERIVSLGPKHIVTGDVNYFSQGQLQEGFEKYAAWLNDLNRTNTHFNSIYRECVIASPAWMARKEELLAIRAFNEAEYPEDYDLVFKWYKHGFKISAVPEVIHKWRDHPNRASRNDPNYQNNLFAHLKVKYFVAIDLDQTKLLCLWGAGAKAKRIAKELIAKDQQFLWLTDNEKKIGKQIYGIPITSIDQIPGSERQVIVAISDKQFQKDKACYYEKYKLTAEERFEFT